MFKVKLRENSYSWKCFNFEFETLDEAKEFISTALNQYVAEEDQDVLVAEISYNEVASSAKDEEAE